MITRSSVEWHRKLRQARWAGLALAFTLSTAGPALGQAPDTAPSPAADTTQAAGAPVVIRGDTLFTLYGTLGPFTPAARASALVGRIDSLAKMTTARSTAVDVVDSTFELRAGSVALLRILPEDTVGPTRPRLEVAQVYAQRVQEAIQGRGRSVTIRSLLLGTLWTLLATGALVALFKLLNRFFPAFYAKLESWRETRIPALKIQRLELISSTRLTDAIIAVAKVLRVVTVILLLYFFLPLVLGFFPWTRRWSAALINSVLDPLQRGWQAFVSYIPDLITVAVIVVVTIYVLKFIRLFFNGIERGHIRFRSFYREWADPTYTIVRFFVIVFAAIMIYPYMPGSDTAAFKGISVFLGVLISFGSSSAIANVVAGVVMTYMRPFQIGDRVKIADTIGDVVAKTLLVTRVRTIKNVDITVPNAMVLSSHIINFSSSAKRRGVILHTAVTIGYDAPWKKVHELLLAAAKDTEKILDDPVPFVLQTSLNDFNVTYEINAYTDAPNQMAVIYSELHQRIQDAFNAAGVEIMSPSFAAVRDGNRMAIPDEYLPASYTPPTFGFRALGQTVRRGGEEPDA
ncbi:MAG TPA: mechanosensitive ion channel family protein [Gemmatimonadales bacterium]|nr:mechanosensitive ion channel family protein [Gemmatimonadales bacterium]